MPLVVHTLHFADTERLQRSFEEVMSWESVEDCLVEPERLRLRFLAPARLADPLVERLYLQGGLTWCSRHVLRAASGEPA